MLSGLLLNPLLKANEIRQVKYTLDPYKVAHGPVKAMQKFTVILMTTKGTDRIRPWFGTSIPEITLMNATSTNDIKLFVKEQVESAIKQFFDLQSQDSKYHYNDIDTYDIILAIDIVSIDVNADNHIDVKLRFTPATRDSIILSLEV